MSCILEICFTTRLFYDYNLFYFLGNYFKGHCIEGRKFVRKIEKTMNNFELAGATKYKTNPTKLIK